jgi:phage terminase small subunit
MTDIQRRFVEEYLIDCKGTAAAVRAGYSPKSARFIAYELKQNPEVKAAIAERLRDLAMSAEEALKRISDIASTRLNDYLIITKEPEEKLVRRPLSYIISELEREIELERRFLERAELSVQDRTERLAKQRARQLQLLHDQIELQYFPKACRDVVETELVDKVKLDLVALSKAYDRGLIKKLSYNAYGPIIEMYPADKAYELILRYHGKLSTSYNLMRSKEPAAAGRNFLTFLRDSVEFTEGIEPIMIANPGAFTFH